VVNEGEVLLVDEETFVGISFARDDERLAWVNTVPASQQTSSYLLLSPFRVASRYWVENRCWDESLVWAVVRHQSRKRRGARVRKRT